nr:MAG TPA: hypothetical protein [Caudoviricetes sp.]
MTRCLLTGVTSTVSPRPRTVPCPWPGRTWSACGGCWRDRTPLSSGTRSWRPSRPWWTGGVRSPPWPRRTGTRSCGPVRRAYRSGGRRSPRGSARSTSVPPCGAWPAACGAVTRPVS